MSSYNLPPGVTTNDPHINPRADEFVGEVFSNLDAEFKAEVFEFLDDLRESGTANMLGAAPSIQAEFNVNKETARTLLQEWRETKGGTRAS